MAFKLGDNDNDMNSYLIKLKTHSIRENLCLILFTNLSKPPCLVRPWKLQETYYCHLHKTQNLQCLLRYVSFTNRYT